MEVCAFVPKPIRNYIRFNLDGAILEQVPTIEI